MLMIFTKIQFAHMHTQSTIKYLEVHIYTLMPMHGLYGAGALNYSSKPRIAFWKLDVTSVVLGAIIAVTIII